VTFLSKDDIGFANSDAATGLKVTSAKKTLFLTLQSRFSFNRVGCDSSFSLPYCPKPFKWEKF